MGVGKEGGGLGVCVAVGVGVLVTVGASGVEPADTLVGEGVAGTVGGFSGVLTAVVLVGVAGIEVASAGRLVAEGEGKGTMEGEG